MTWQRNEPSSDCTRCGLCCGRAHPTTGHVAAPWSPDIGTVYRNFGSGPLAEAFEYIGIIGAYPVDPDGKRRPQYFTGNKRIGSGPNSSFRVKWTFENGFRKPTNMECPCLVGAEADAVRPCALIGSDFDALQQSLCGPDGALCPAIIDDWNHDDWVENFGENGVGPEGDVGCIFTWTKL